VKPDVVRRTLDLAPEAFDYLVLDTASTFSESSLIALEMADHIVLPLTPDIAALKTTVNTVRILKAVNIRDEKMQVVLNEIIPKAGLTKQQVDTSLGKQSIAVPHAGAAFIDAANHGMPLVTLEDPPAAARALIDLARTVCEPEDVPVEAQKETKLGILNRLRRA